MKKEPKMTEVAPMYVYATEMVAQYYKRISLKGKRVLTVAGSGDQVVNALYYGASEVVAFDINRNALFMTELKIAAIRTLSLSEFSHFFSQTQKGFDQALYLKMRPLLSKECQKYFDRLYKEIGTSGLGVSDYFRSRNNLVDKKKAREVNAYLADIVAYRKMKEILEHNHPVLRIENVLNLSTNEEFRGKKFDVINLSNIPNYLAGRSFGLTESQILSYFKKLKMLCSKQGAIFFYSFDNSVYPNPMSKIVPPASSPAFLKMLKQSGAFSVSQKSFPGLDGVGKKDRITILGHAKKRAE
ncbi:MAG: DUF3419 family protein [Candidatus Paceibacterota bacterium]